MIMPFVRTPLAVILVLAMMDFVEKVIVVKVCFQNSIISCLWFIDISLFCYIEIRCLNPGKIRYGSYVTQVGSDKTWGVNETLEFKCDQYYEIAGKNPITCLSTGRWSSAIPECVGKKSIFLTF